MKKQVVSSFIAGLILVCLCSTNASPGEAVIRGAVGERVIELKVDLKKERELQAWVDEGHQPWRLEAVWVGYITAGRVDKGLDYEDCHVIFEKVSEAEVECKRNKTYLVKLRRLVRPAKDGLWTAISVRIN